MKKQALMLTFFTILLFFMNICVLSGCQTNEPTTTTAATTTSQTNKPTTTQETTHTEETSQTTTETTTTETTTPTKLTVADYFPLTANVFRKYTGTGNEYVPMSVYVDYVQPGKIQMVEINGATDIHTLYAVGKGVVQILYSKADLYIREDLSDYRPIANGEILLKEPLVVGTSWNVDGNTRTITSVDNSVTTPAGTYQALEVTTEERDITTRQYYAEGIGLIKMTITGAYEINQELEQMKTQVTQSQTMTFYYPRQTTKGIEIAAQTISLKMKTNTGLKEILTQYFKTPLTNDQLPLITENVVIQKITSNLNDGIITIDFSKNLVSDMNLGAEKEAAVIRCIVNTLGQAYDVRKVIITLDGALYESGHIALAPGESFMVDYKGVVKQP